VGEAKRRRQGQATRQPFTRVDEKLRRLGVDVSALGYYDQPAFLALERIDPLALELYSTWVINRPRDSDYDNHARQTIPRLAAIVEHRLASEKGLGACVNVATMMARMLDRLGVWSFAVRGSLTLEIPSCPSVGSRHFPECDLRRHEDDVTGHGWLVAPPFLVVDSTLKHQQWIDLHPVIAELLPKVVAIEDGAIIQPRWDDVVSDSLIEQYHVPRAELKAGLAYRFQQNLSRIEKSLPGRDIRIGALSLRYIAGVVTVSEAPLEQIPPVSPISSRLKPIDIWNEDVAPAFRAGITA